MVHLFCRSFLCALALVVAASPATAAPFLLPDDASLDVREFAFPEAGAASGRNLPAEFHAHLVFALQKNGLAVFREVGDAATREAPGSAPLVVTPLPPHDGTTGASAAPEEDADTQADEPRGGFEEDGSDGESEGAPDATAEDVETVPAHTPGDRSRAARPTHILEGRVTLFRETVGAPARVGGAIRIRTEAALHCTYTIRDAATGKVLVSDVSSGSSAKVISQTQDIDAALAGLSTRAMTAAAARIAASLSGALLPEQEGTSDRAYYQDSPGKRLKPRK